jgi:hypothetical protein
VGDERPGRVLRSAGPLIHVGGSDLAIEPDQLFLWL